VNLLDRPLGWQSKSGRAVSEPRNTGPRPVRQADILSAFRLAWKRSATPLGAQTWRSMFRLATCGTIRARLRRTARTFKACFRETRKPTLETRALPRGI